MKKMLLLLCSLILVSGCSNGATRKTEMNSKYENYIELIINNNNVNSLDIPFQHSLEITQNTKGKYVYTVSIFSPRVAMYDIELMAVDINTISVNSVAPSIGVVEDEQFNMIPFQSDQSKGFYQGMSINGESDSPTFMLSCLVVYQDFTKVGENYIYFTISGDYADYSTEREITKEEPVEEDREEESDEE